MKKSLKSGFILSLDYFYENINMGVVNSILKFFKGKENLVGIKVNSYERILDVKYSTSLPIIGYTDRVRPNSFVSITSSMEDVHMLVKGGSNIIYLDASVKMRDNSMGIYEFYYNIREDFPEISLIGEVKTKEDIINISSLDFDYVCIKGDYNLIDECHRYIKNSSFILDGPYDLKQEEMFNMGFNNIIINSRIFTPEYNINVFREKIFS